MEKFHNAFTVSKIENTCSSVAAIQMLVRIRGRLISIGIALVRRCKLKHYSVLQSTAHRSVGGRSVDKWVGQWMSRSIGGVDAHRSVHTDQCTHRRTETRTSSSRSSSAGRSAGRPPVRRSAGRRGAAAARAAGRSCGCTRRPPPAAGPGSSAS